MAPTVSTLDQAREVMAGIVAGGGREALAVTTVYLTLEGVGPVAVLRDGTVRQAAVTTSGEWVTL